MTKKIISAVALALSAMSAQASVVINEGFENVQGLATQGWIFSNASSQPGATHGWFQGNANGWFFPAQAGSDDSYAAANYQNTASGGSFNSWMLTSAFDASNGATATFYLRAMGEGFADQINFGFLDAGGTFNSASLTSVNPVPDGSWVQYTASIGADLLTTARFAFQYVGTYDTANFVGVDSLIVDTSAAPNDVPEPASLALLAAGLLGIGAARRRTRT